jgi:hypothetical protein
MCNELETASLALLQSLQPVYYTFQSTREGFTGDALLTVSSTNNVTDVETGKTTHLDLTLFQVADECVVRLSTERSHGLRPHRAKEGDDSFPLSVRPLVRSVSQDRQQNSTRREYIIRGLLSFLGPDGVVNDRDRSGGDSGDVLLRYRFTAWDDVRCPKTAQIFSLLRRGSGDDGRESRYFCQLDHF